MLHDTLSGAGAPEQFERIYGRAAAAGHFGLVASFLAGGFLAGRVGFEIPLALVAGPWLAAVAIAAGVDDPPRGTTSAGHGEIYLETLRAGLWEVRSSVRLLHVIGMTASIACIWEVFEEYLPVYLDENERSRWAPSGSPSRVLPRRPSSPRRLRIACRFDPCAPSHGRSALQALCCSRPLPRRASWPRGCWLPPRVNGGAGVPLAGQFQRSIRGHAGRGFVATAPAALRVGRYRLTSPK